MRRRRLPTRGVDRALEAGAPDAHDVVFSAMRFPWDDAQFWIVTAIFALAAGYLLRNVVPVPWLSKRSRRRRSEQKAVLTISAKRPTGDERGLADADLTQQFPAERPGKPNH